MQSSFLTRDQALSLGSGSTNSKTLDYQRTNPGEYQIVKTHTEQTTWIQDPALPCAGRLIWTTNKTKIQTQSSADRIAISLSLVNQRKNKQKLTTNLSLYKVKRKWNHSFVSYSVTPWTVTYQASPSMGFSRQEYWNGLSFPAPGYLPDAGIEPRSPALRADTLPSQQPESTLQSLHKPLNQA